MRNICSLRPHQCHIYIYIELGPTKCYNAEPNFMVIVSNPRLPLNMFVYKHTHTETKRPLATIPELNIRSVVLGLAKRWGEREKKREGVTVYRC